VPLISILIGLFCVSFLFLYENFGYSFFLFNGQYSNDDFSLIFKFFVLFFLILVFVIFLNYIHLEKITLEYIFICLLSVSGSLLLLSCNDFILVYLGLELQTFAFFILISLEITRSVSVEASLKYFLLSAIMSGLYLIGVSFIYTFFGFVNFIDIYDFLFNNEYIHESYHAAFLGILLVFVVFLFKLTLVPFHN